jgi:hypothetical protein
MGLFSSPAKVYKPAAEVDLGPGSDEFYISPNVKGPIYLAAGCRLRAEFGVPNSVLGVEGNSAGLNSVLGVHTREFCLPFFSQILCFLIILAFDVQLLGSPGSL